MPKTFPEIEPTVVAQVSPAANTFQQPWAGYTPHGVPVVVGGETLMVTLGAALTPSERNPERRRAMAISNGRKT
jgi:hypothetical protein